MTIKYTYVEPSENHHKYIRFYRAHHAPQTTLIENLKAVFLRCMQIADPVNLKLMAKLEPPRKVTPLPEDVMELLIIPSPPTESGDGGTINNIGNDTSSDSDSDDELTNVIEFFDPEENENDNQLF